MRRVATCLVALTLAVPAAACAQAAVPEFSRVLSTYLLAGCAATLAGEPAPPCVRGLASFGQLSAGQYGLRYDLAADFSGFGAPTPLVSAHLVSGSRFAFSTVGAAGTCIRPRPGGRCAYFQFGPGNGGGSRTGPDVLPGQAVSFLQLVDGLLGVPETFRLEDVTLVYDVHEAAQTTVRVVSPTITATPEPTVLALAGVGLTLVAAYGRRRRGA